MTELDEIYLQILCDGILTIRFLAAGGDNERVFAEADHIHNLPSLIGNSNHQLHLHYARITRPSYLKWLRNHIDLTQYDFTNPLFEPLWKRLDSILGIETTGDSKSSPGPDRSKSLQELELDNWSEPNFDSHLVKTCHELRRKPLVEFSVEDLRIMIGQQISLAILIPIALERLERDAFAAGDCYPGDLLNAVVAIDESFWGNRGELLLRIRRIVAAAESEAAADDGIGRRIPDRIPQWLTSE